MKHYITFKLKDENRTIKVTTDAVDLFELIFAFENFLRGCGFQIKTGTLEINSEDEEVDLEYIEDKNPDKSGAV